MNENERIVYSISVEDLQHVADSMLERQLTDTEIDLLDRHLGDYIDWYEGIVAAINEVIINARKEQKDFHP